MCFPWVAIAKEKTQGLRNKVVVHRCTAPCSRALDRGFYFQRLWGEIQTFLFTLYLIKNRCYIKQFCFGDLFFLVNTLHPNSILSVHICGNIHFKITIFSHTRIFVCLVVVAVVAYSNFTFKRLKPVTFCV